MITIIKLGFGSDTATKKVYEDLRDYVKKDIFPEYSIAEFEENKARNSFKFTIEYDEDDIHTYMIWYEAGILNIEPDIEDYNIEDIAFILYPIAEMLL